MPRTQIQHIKEHIERSYRQGAWHGPALLETLQDVNAEQAAAKPITDAHSIWEFVLHCTTWIRVVERLTFGELCEPSPDEDWHQVSEVSDGEWQRALKRLDDEHRRLLDVLSLVDDSILTKIVPGKKYPYLILLHGIAEHNIYHAGQIMLLRRVLGVVNPRPYQSATVVV